MTHRHAIREMNAPEQASYMRFVRRGWAVFGELTADAAAFAAYCVLTMRPMLAVERIGNRWLVSLDTSTVGREPTAQEFAIVSLLARRAGAGPVVAMGLGVSVYAPDFRTAARLAARLARSLQLEEVPHNAR